MLLKSHNKYGAVCWSNSKSNSHLLACAGIHPNASETYDLEILSLDVIEKSKLLPVIASTTYSKAFRSVAWDNFGQKEGTYPYGLIFGGMEDGGITLWSPSDIIKANKEDHSDTNRKGLIFEDSPVLDEFPVMCAEWNALRPNLLAYGTTEVLILDIGKGFDDIYVKPGEKNPHAGSYVTGVTWNKEVPYILASASENGQIALWDIKTNNSIFQFKDSSLSSSGNRKVSISWSKSFSTQIAVTLDDEKKNELQIWDLRNQKGPIIVIDKGHSKGINSMDWCDSDPELILTSGRDKKLICWNYVRDQQIISETQLDEEILDLKWSKKLPSIYSVTTQSKVNIYSMNESNLYSYVPKWYKIPVGTTFGPNNNLLSYNQNEGSVLTEYRVEYKTEELQPVLQKLEGLISQKEHMNQNYASNKADQTQSATEKQFWDLLRLLSADYDSSDLYNYLGLNKDKIIKEVEKYTGKKHSDETVTSKKTGTTKPTTVFAEIKGDDAVNFFESIANNAMKRNEPKPVEEGEVEDQNVEYESIKKNFNWNVGVERMVKQNLLIGNYNGAIDAALKCGRGAEALVIAYSQGHDVFKNTLKIFFTETTDSFITNVLRHIADKEIEDLVNKYDLVQWKECVALVFSMCRDQRSIYLKQLANRLLKEKESSDQALVCLVLAEDFDQVVKLFYNEVNTLAPRSLVRKMHLLNVLEKVIFLQNVMTKEIHHSSPYEKLLLEASLIAYDQGNSTLAYSILEYNVQNSPRVEYIKAMIANSNKALQGRTAPIRPTFVVPVMAQPKKAPVQTQQVSAPGTQQPKKAIFTPVNPAAKVTPPAPPQNRNTPPPPPPSVPSHGFNPNAQPVTPVTPVTPSISTLHSPPPPPAPTHPTRTSGPLNVPPPPPPKVTHAPVNPIATVQPEAPSASLFQTSAVHSPPPPPPSRPGAFNPASTKTNVPPPPPPAITPKKVSQPEPKSSNQIPYSQPTQTTVAPSVTSTRPPPPPPPSRSHAPTTVTSTNTVQTPPPPPPSRPAAKIPPPPPPSVQNVPPPPTQNSPPPPPPAQNTTVTPAVSPAVSVPPPARRVPPPPPPRR